MIARIGEVAVALGVCFCLMVNANGASEDPDTQFWTDFSSYYPLTENFDLGGDFGFRTTLEGKEGWQVLYVRPSFDAKIHPRIRLLGGIGYFHSFVENRAREVRIWEGISVNLPRISIFQFNNYARVEHRFLGAKSFERYFRIVRLRYRFGATVPLGSKNASSARYYVPVSYEWFANVGGDVAVRILNQQRLWVGIGWRVNNSWRMEMSYLHQRSRARSSDPFEPSENIFRLQFKH